MRHKQIPNQQARRQKELLSNRSDELLTTMLMSSMLKKMCDPMAEAPIEVIQLKKGYGSSTAQRARKGCLLACFAMKYTKLTHSNKEQLPLNSLVEPQSGRPRHDLVEHEELLRPRSEPPVVGPSGRCRAAPENSSACVFRVGFSSREHPAVPAAAKLPLLASMNSDQLYPPRSSCPRRRLFDPHVFVVVAHVDARIPVTRRNCAVRLRASIRARTAIDRSWWLVDQMTTVCCGL